jgi:phospholipid-binding lipoprotein MlaA
VVLPFFGPSTVRDTAALPVDWEGDLWHHVYPVDIRNSGMALRVVEQRAAALDASSLVESAALDRYEFVRDGYLQRRESKIKGDDSKPPKQNDGSSMNTPQPQPDAAADLNNAAVKPGEEPEAGSSSDVR